MSQRTFGFDLNPYANDRLQCVRLCAEYLNKNKLGLMLGAGVSKALLLPDWYDLLKICLGTIDPAFKFPTKKKCTTDILKDVANKIKRHFSGKNREYLDLIQNALYDKFTPDFTNANKDLLIALSALFVGKRRGNVSEIITYNYDSILEWYLTTIGLSTNQTGNNYIRGSVPDVEILHIHGYIPYSKDYGRRSPDILLTKKDFEDRAVGSSHYKTIATDFYQRHLFVTVGMSANSIIDDVCPYLRDLYAQNDVNKIIRDQPFGVAIINACTAQQKEDMIEDGIIPLTIASYNDVPKVIFEIAQKAVQ